MPVFCPHLFAAAVLVLLHWLAAVVTFHSRFVGYVLKAGKISWSKDGEIQWKLMKKNSISKNDIEETIRKYR